MYTFLFYQNWTFLFYYFQLVSLGSPDYGFHLFRHTHDSMLLNAGTNWKELQVRMRHKSMSTTMDTYAELAPQRKLEAVSIYLDKIAELIY
ncbi:tyrosine-type recombinase/integrase [Gemella taiwanensis]